MNDVIIQMFGAFRPMGTDIRLSLPVGATVVDVRKAFSDKIPGDLHDLLAVSRFADERAILAENAVLPDGAKLAILPPVSGG